MSFIIPAVTEHIRTSLLSNESAANMVIRSKISGFTPNSFIKSKDVD